jgi:hypothetical protein
MNSMKKYLLMAAAFIFFTIGCKKDKDYTKATVIDTGDITTTGCGYILRLDDGREEKPEYLASDFQQNNLKVKVRFHSSGILDTCGSIPPLRFFQTIYIDDIKKDID